MKSRIPSITGLHAERVKWRDHIVTGTIQLEMSKIIYPTWNSLDNSPPRLVRWTFSPGDGHAWLDLGKEHLAGLFGRFPALLVRLRTLLGDDNSLTLFSLAGLVAELLEKPALIWREQSLLFCFLALGSSQDATAFSWNLFLPTIQISIKTFAVNGIE